MLYSLGLADIVIYAEILLLIFGPTALFFAIHERRKKEGVEDTGGTSCLVLVTMTVGFVLIAVLGDQISAFNEWLFEAVRGWANRSPS